VVGVVARAASASAWESPESGTTLELLAARGIFPDAENPRSAKDRYRFLCPLPGHANDTHPSFSVHADGVRWHCFPCGAGGGPGKLIELLSGGPTARIPRPPKPLKKPAKELEKPLQGCTLAQLAETKGLPIEHLRNLGWHDSEWKYKFNGHWTTCPSVAMPYPHSVQHRVGLTDKKNRFRWQVGSEASARELYGTEWLRAIDKTVLVVEGTTDVRCGRSLAGGASGRATRHWYMVEKDSAGLGQRAGRPQYCLMARAGRSWAKIGRLNSPGHSRSASHPATTWHQGRRRTT
jgi:hypothetical protein